MTGCTITTRGRRTSSSATGLAAALTAALALAGCASGSTPSATSTAGVTTTASTATTTTSSATATRTADDAAVTALPEDALVAVALNPAYDKLTGELRRGSLVLLGEQDSATKVIQTIGIELGSVASAGGQVLFVDREHVSRLGTDLTSTPLAIKDATHTDAFLSGAYAGSLYATTSRSILALTPATGTGQVRQVTLPGLVEVYAVHGTSFVAVIEAESASPGDSSARQQSAVKVNLATGAVTTLGRWAVGDVASAPTYGAPVHGGNFFYVGQSDDGASGAPVLISVSLTTGARRVVPLTGAGGAAAAETGSVFPRAMAVVGGNAYLLTSKGVVLRIALATGATSTAFNVGLRDPASEHNTASMVDGKLVLVDAPKTSETGARVTAWDLSTGKVVLGPLERPVLRQITDTDGTLISAVTLIRR